VPVREEKEGKKTGELLVPDLPKVTKAERL
jgi:hypothetical protein